MSKGADDESPTAELERTLPRADSIAVPPAPAADDFGDFTPVERANYRMGDEFARGGLGKISQAYDRRLRRLVALKELLGRDPRAEARFLREAYITARLQHPNIVAIHEAGRWPGGERFYAMKLVEGRTLADQLELAGSRAERLALLPAIIDVADAVAYAHSQRILHRDLKPSNVMVGPFGETVVIDWGLAKQIDEDEAGATPPAREPSSAFETTDGMVVGTPAYMPPEQAMAQRIDERADVYAIGAMLYHVLSGQRPYHEVKPKDVLQAVATRPPVSLVELAPKMPRDLIAIVEKAMARDPKDRYRTARQMVEELRRFSTGQLVAAHEYSSMEIVWRFARRHQAAVVTGILALVVLLTVAAFSYVRIDRARGEAVENAKIAMRKVEELTLEQARSLLDRDPTRSMAILKTLTDPPPGSASVAAEAEERGVALRVFTGHQDRVNDVAVSADGRWVASASTDKSVRLWDVASGKATALLCHLDRVASVAFAPDGALLASGGYDHRICLYDAKLGQGHSLLGPTGPVQRVIWTPDGKLLIALSDDRFLRIYGRDGTLIKAIETEPLNREAFLVLSKDGRTLLSGGYGDRVRLVDLEAQTSRAFVAEGRVNWAALSPGADKIAIALGDGSIQLSNVATGQSEHLRGHLDQVRFVAFSTDGGRLVSAGLDHTIRVWDLATLKSEALVGHTERVAYAHFVPDGTKVVSASWDRTVRIWDLASRESRVLLGHEDEISALAASTDESFLASGSGDGTIRLWRVAGQGGRVLSGHSIGVHAVDFSPDGGILASGGHDNEVRLWPLAGSEAPRILRGHADHIYRVKFLPDGRWVASSSDDKTVRLWSTSSDEVKVLEGHTADVEELAVSADGRRLASAGEDDAVWLWTVPQGAGRALVGHRDHVTDLAFDPKRPRLASSSRDGTVRVWDLGTGTSTALRGPVREVWSVAYSPSGEELASVGADDTLRRYDAATLSPLGTKEGIFGARWVRYSPDGRFIGIATSGQDVWLCQRAYPICDRWPGQKSVVWALAFALGGQAMVTGAGDGTVQIWDVETGEYRVLRGHSAAVYDVAISPDGKTIASASADTDVRVWPVVLPPRPKELRRWLDERTSATLEQRAPR